MSTPVYYFSDCVAPGDEAVSRLQMNYYALAAHYGMALTLQMTGSLPGASVHTAFQALSTLAGISHLHAQRYGLGPLPSQILAVNNASRSHHSGQSDAGADALLWGRLRDPVTGVQHHLVGYDQYVMGFAAPWLEDCWVVEGFSALPALRDLRRGSQFRSLEYLPYVHLQLLRTGGEEIPGAQLRALPIPSLPDYTLSDAAQLRYLGADRFGNGRFQLPCRSFPTWWEHFSRAPQLTLHREGQAPMTLAVGESLTQVPEEMPALWPSSSWLLGDAEGYAVVLNWGQRYDLTAPDTAPAYTRSLPVGSIVRLTHER
ncbi:hypothetical protein H6771_00130 [Candidatus Peribacteria bacterium]|nr:hypothetical protein [Candidatus Peribacteria bacterium]